MGTTQKNIRIGIVEDHPVTLEGVVSILEGHHDMKVTLKAGSAEMLLHQLESKTIDILLLDLYLPGMDGDELLPLLAEKHPAVKTIMLSIENSPYIMLYALQAGARAFLTKTCSIDEMVSTVRKVHECGTCIPDAVAVEAIKQLNKTTQLAERIGPFAGFTDCELQCLKLTVQCLTVPETADCMNKSANTVKGYRKALYKKTNCKNVAELVQYAIRHGLPPVKPVQVLDKTA